MDRLADEEYDKIVETRLKWKEASVLKNGSVSDHDLSFHRYHAQQLYALFVPSQVRTLLGEEADFFYGMGMVRFTTISGKQSATQCNLSGQSVRHFLIRCRMLEVNLAHYLCWGRLLAGLDDYE